jgi:hypothetical protein
MPIYIYRHPTKNIIKEVIQGINDKHEYVEDGVIWLRVFTIPEVNTNSKLTAESTAKDFAEYTKNHKGNVGDLWDRSAELSQKRERIYGKDPIKEKYIKASSKKRKNKKFLD